jgi:hypothetical protein
VSDLSECIQQVRKVGGGVYDLSACIQQQVRDDGVSYLSICI